MSLPLSNLGAPAETKPASEIPNPKPEVSTEEAERFWTDGTGARSPEPDADIRISPERSRKLSSLLFTSRALVTRLTLSRTDRPGESSCLVCGALSINGVPKHHLLCEVGPIQTIITELLEIPSQSAPVQKRAAEVSQPVRADMDEVSVDAQERIAECLRFCEGIPTEILRRELPLASDRRLRWHEIQHLRVALPWLPAVTL